MAQKWRQRCYVGAWTPRVHQVEGSFRNDDRVLRKHYRPVRVMKPRLELLAVRRPGVPAAQRFEQSVTVVTGAMLMRAV
jgi:hypothetical protein